MTKYNYYEYVFKSGEIIYVSYKMKEGGKVMFFNFTQGEGNIKTFGSNHPVRKEARKAHD